MKDESRTSNSVAKFHVQIVVPCVRVMRKEGNNLARVWHAILKRE